MMTETKTQEVPESATTRSDSQSLPKRMIRLSPTQGLGERFPAMHLVRSSWFARTLSRLVLLFLVGFTICAIFLPWQQTSLCDGKVVARSPQMRRQPVESPIKGVVKFVNQDLLEGTWVEAGQIILELEPQVENQVELSQRAVDEVERNILLQQSVLNNTRQIKKTELDNFARNLESVEAGIKSAEAKWEQTRREIDSQKAVHDQAVQVLKSYTETRGRLISELEYLEAVNKEESEEQKLLTFHAKEDEAFNDLVEKQKSQQSKVKEIEGKSIELDSKIFEEESKLAKLNKDLTDVKSKRGEFNRLKIPSPSSGWIQSVMAQQGTNAVKEGDILFEVVPDTSDLAVELNVNGNDFPLIALGDQVRLQFEGWPAVQYVGWPSVAVGTFPGKVIAINQTDDSKGSFKILVGPDLDDPKQVTWPDRRYNDYYLRQGGKVNGWVILRTVPLGFEIWRQLNGFPASKSDPGNSKTEKDPKLPKFK
jgi:multidrug resistance efflux pump